MKFLKTLFVTLVAVICIPVFAQDGKKQVVRETEKGQVVRTAREEHLILYTTQPSRTIEIKMDAAAWKTLDDLVAGPIGEKADLKDINGKNVSVSHGNVNGKSGLMFFSGSWRASITDTDYRKMRR